MKKGALAAVGAAIWLSTTYFVVGYLINQNCYIQSRTIVWIHNPYALTDYSPIFGQASFVQRKLNDSKREVGFLSDSAIQEVIQDEGLYHCVLLKADSSYYEVLCMGSSERGLGSYVATPDTIYSLEYRPIIIKTVSE
ncbi:hypothetical protein [Pontibacter ummariensis]|uniref:hypothetical protein n=1 Tax=Pontibacter ummariensis TaxID=1610492 RepID=UPI000B7731D5|nr:hypothetical protein [Pontibacter ummariensis]